MTRMRALARPLFLTSLAPLAALAALTALIPAQELAAQRATFAAHMPPVAAVWRDTAHHRPGFVSVAPNVRIHYLDWGGSGPALVLLAGLGNTAHAFDDFAPAFAGRYHVVALTRRGFGESSHPDDGYDIPTLVADIHAVIDSLHLGKVILIGHSIAGEEMTRFAAMYPERVAKLVYLDAAYDRLRGDSLAHANVPAGLDLPAPPTPSARDTASAAAYVAFVHRTRGVNIPEADIRARYDNDGWNEETTRAYQAITVETPPYAEVRAPALGVYAVTDNVSQLEPWQRADRTHRAALAAMVRDDEAINRVLRAEFHRLVPHNEVVELHGAHHWLFVSNRDAVVAAVRRFLAE